MKEYITASTNKAAALKCLSGMLPEVRIQKGRGVYVYPICAELANAMDALRNPDTKVNLRSFLDSLTSVKDQLFSCLNSKED